MKPEADTGAATEAIRIPKDLKAELDSLKENAFEPYWSVIRRILSMRPCPDEDAHRDDETDQKAVAAVGA